MTGGNHFLYVTGNYVKSKHKCLLKETLMTFDYHSSQPTIEKFKYSCTFLVDCFIIKIK